MALLNAVSQSLSTGSMIALPLAFAGGIVAGMNPCCLALYPAAAGACCCKPSQAKRRTFGNALAFVLGIAIAVMTFGILRTVISAWHAGVAGAAQNRLITRHSVAFGTYARA